MVEIKEQATHLLGLADFRKVIGVDSALHWVSYITLGGALCAAEPICAG